MTKYDKEPLFIKSPIKKVERDSENASIKGLISSMCKELVEISRESTDDTMGKRTEDKNHKKYGR